MTRMMRLAACLLLAGCSSRPHAAYHTQVEHAYELRETAQDLHLGGLQTDAFQSAAFAFGQSRPNDGSSFTVMAEPLAAEVIVAGLQAAGVVRADIDVVPTERTAMIRRVDRSAYPKGCYGRPDSKFDFAIDDGYGHDNANSALLGCAMRRNIAAMSADPRTLFAATAPTGREGARAADIYAKWTKGQSTDSQATATAASTSALGGASK